MHLKSEKLGMRIRMAPKNSTSQLHIALTPLATVHIHKSMDHFSSHSHVYE
jgi:hypothetical protein